MPHRPRLSPSLLVAMCLATLPAAARAQTVSAECKPLLDAQRKEITTPHHAYSTQSPAGQRARKTTGETIYAGGANYLFYKGKWMRSPLTMQMQLDQMQENIKNAKVLSCRREGEESVGGVAAVVYTTHTENEDTKADARHWVAKSSGLLLRTEEDIDTGDGDRRHVSVRYEYTNVRPPAVQ